MLPRKETKYIVVTATLTDERITRHEIEWRARKYGYLDAGSHFVIEPGSVTACRQLRLMGVGARPHNQTSIIIQLSGKPSFPIEMMGDLDHTIEACLTHYPDAAVVGHDDLPGAKHMGSPGFDVKAWWTGWQATKAIGA